MKKIINGKLYDTNSDNVTYIVNYSYEAPESPLHINEKLYQKRNGEFFLVGEGGHSSKYKMILYISGSDITPLTTEEAKEWVEKHFDADTYIEVFGEPKE